MNSQEKLVKAEAEAKKALDEGMRAIENARSTFQDAADQMAQYAKTYKEGCDAPTRVKPEEVLIWVINHITSNVLNNTRCDILARVVSRIATQRMVVELENES